MPQAVANSAAPRHIPHASIKTPNTRTSKMAAWLPQVGVGKKMGVDSPRNLEQKSPAVRRAPVPDTVWTWCTQGRHRIYIRGTATRGVNAVVFTYLDGAVASRLNDVVLLAECEHVGQPHELRNS